MYYIQTAENEGEEPVELPLEADYTLAMTTLTAQYPGASGLKYRSENGGWRGLRVTDGKVYQVESNWGNATYIAVYPKDNKRKGDSDIEADNPNTKAKRVDSKIQRCSDLIVLGLPWKTDEEDLKTFFGQFGELVMAQVKRDAKTSQSKGYGFIRFKDYEVQQKVTAQRHCIDGRWCDVRIPNSKGGEMMTQYSRKIFVGRVSEDLTKADLKDYFSKYGEVTDVFIPTPHRAFAFVTFVDPTVAQHLQDAGEDHLIKGCSVNISNATAKNPDRGRGNNPEQNGYPGNAGHTGGGDYGGFGYGYGQSGYGANSGANGARGPGGAGGGGMPPNAGGGGMDMNSMMNMNPAMMQSMMQMMMMSGMMGGGGGGGAGGSFGAGGAGGAQSGAPGTEKAANGAASKPDSNYGYGWSSDGKSGGGGGGYGAGGYGTGWGSSGWGK